MNESAPVSTDQANLYVELQNYNLTEKLERGTDYFLVGDIKGVKYYSPNDEGWGAIIAVSEEHKLAIDTGFYEMDDMEYPDSDYAQVVHNGQLMCGFEAS